MESGKSATAPAVPKRVGYTFKGWDKDFSRVTGDMTVTAQWEKNVTPAPEKIVNGTFLAKLTAKGSRNLVLSWNKTNGAEGYDVFFEICSKKQPRLTVTVKGNKNPKWTFKKLKRRQPISHMSKPGLRKMGRRLMSKNHTAPLRYLSTNPGVAEVTKKGKITGHKSGRCYVYVFAHNGVSKRITVLVK